MYISDGEIHVLDDKWAYIIELDKKITLVIDHPILKSFIHKYAEYLFETGFRNGSIEEIKANIGICTPWHSFPDSDQYQFIYKQEWEVNGLKQPSSLALRFMRAPNDQEYFDKHKPSSD